MSKRDTLLKIAKQNLNKSLSEAWFKDNYPEFFYVPDVVKAQEELDMCLIEGLLWDYLVSFNTKETDDGTYRKKANSLCIKSLPEKKKSEAFYVFLSLAQPNDEGYAVVNKVDFEEAGLQLGNGGSWCRDSSRLAHIFIVNRHKDLGGGKNTITSVALEGWNREIKFSQRIKKEIFDVLRNKSCVIMGITGKSENTTIEIDHKDGRKNDAEYNNVALQQESWFQPLCKAANDIKRQKCKECKESNKRWKASEIAGYEDFPFYEGDENYNKNLGCVGCFLYDPVEFRKQFRNFIRKKTMEDMIAI